MSVLRNPRKHLCYSVSPCSWFKPQVSLNISPPEQLGWGRGSGAGRSSAQVLPVPWARRRARSRIPNLPPKWCPVSNPTGDIFLPRPGLPHPHADLISQPELWDEGAGLSLCGSESHMAGPSWSGTPQGPLHLPVECVSEVTQGPRVSTRCKHCFFLLVIFSLTVDTLAPLKANWPVGLLAAEEPWAGSASPSAETPAAWGDANLTSSSLGPLVVGWVVASSSQNRTKRPDGDRRGFSEGIWHAWCRGKKPWGWGLKSRRLTVWFPGQ